MYAELIEKLKAAPGPSNEIDGLLAMALLGWEYTRKKGDRKEYWYDPAPRSHSSGDWRPRLDLPRYTDSIDAALALVEKMLPGSDWSIDCRDEGDAERWFDVTVGVAFVQHRSAPLAILAALLSALSSIKEVGK